MTQSDLQLLYSHPERPYRSIISVYLNVDQSQHSNRNRGFEKPLKDITSAIRSTIHDAAEIERFVAAAHHIEDFVSAYEPGTQGLVMFFDSLDGFFWHQEVGVPIHNQARWNHELDDVPVSVTADWTGLQMTARELSELKPGDVLMLDPQMPQQVRVSIGSTPKYSARLGTRNQNRAVELTHALTN